MPHSKGNKRSASVHTQANSQTKSGRYLVQVTAIRPLGLEYMNFRDDRRNPGT